MIRLTCLLAIGLLLPQLALASDFSALLPFYVVLVLLLGGIVGGFEWVIINAVTDRGENATAGDPESQNMSRFGCGLGVVLWAANSLLAHIVIINIWG